MYGKHVWLTIPLLLVLAACGAAPATEQQGAASVSAPAHHAAPVFTAAAERRPTEVALALPTGAPAALEPITPPPTVAPAPLPTMYAAEEAARNLASPYPTVLVEQVINDPVVMHLVAVLQERGFAPQATDVSRVEWLADAPGQSYQLADNQLYLHPYPTVDAAAAVAAELPGKLRYSLADWVGPPHFFRCERVIALYLGTNEQVLAALTQQCGPVVAELLPPPPVPTDPPLTTIELAINSSVFRPYGATTVSAPVVRRTVPLRSGVAVLYTQEAQVNDQEVAVTHLAYLDWRPPVWYPDGHYVNERNTDEPPPPIQFFTGSYVVNGGTDTPQTPDHVTLAGGLVHDPAIQSVAVTFNDGSQTIVPVEQGAYLAAKVDVDGTTRIEARDGQGVVRYESQSPE